MPAITDIYSLMRFEEGERLTVYDDRTGHPIVPGSVVQGHPTIGIGIRLDGDAGLRPSESSWILSNRVSLLTTELATKPWYLVLGPIRRWAIVNMAFTMGVEDVLKFTDMVAAAGRRDWPAMKAAVLDSAWAKSEAPARAGRVAGMLLTGQWPVIDISS